MNIDLQGKKVSVYGDFEYRTLKWILIDLNVDTLIVSNKQNSCDTECRTFTYDYNCSILRTDNKFAVADVIICNKGTTYPELKKYANKILFV